MPNAVRPRFVCRGAFASAFAVGLAGLLSSLNSVAATRVTVLAGGGLPSLDVHVDLAHGTVAFGGSETAIGLDRAELPAEGDVMVEAVAVGQGRRVAHVRVPARAPASDSKVTGRAWEAVLAAGRATPIFAGVTGFSSGDPGERTGKAVSVVQNGAASYLVVGDIREDLSICGQTGTLLDPQAVYPASLDLRPATVQRLSAAQRASAESVVATDKGSALEPSLAHLLVARGSSVDESRGAELTDGDVRTFWKEQRPGVGQGEFVVMAAPSDVPVTRLQIALSPPSPEGASAAAAPKTFYLVTGAQTFEVALPEDAERKPGEVYEVTLPHPISTSCLSLVLNDGYAAHLAHPDVGLAEVVAYSEFDAAGATLDDVARALSGPRGAAAMQVLERAGDGSLAAVTKAYDALDPRGRARAVDVAAAGPRCEDTVPLLVRALCEESEKSEETGQATRKAREKLERCSGAGPALAQRLKEDAAARACVAPMLAMIAPAQALEPIADAIAATNEADAKTRAVLRASFGAALAASPAGTLAPLVRDARRSAPARLELLRAGAARVTEAPVETEALVTELLKGAPSLRLRYLVIEPLGVLARAGDRAALGHLVDAVAHDPDGPVRARAAEALAGLAGAADALVAGASDPEPRVRQAAFVALSVAPRADAVRAATAALVRDDWSFVKAEAIALLINAPPAHDVDDALGASLDDVAVRVRGAALVALARRRAVAWREAIRKRLDDKDEDAEVRAAAASALGAICDAASTDRLAELTRPLAGVAAGEDAREIGLGALVGLAALHPPDLKDRLAPLLAPGAPPAVRDAATKAVTARAMCQEPRR